MKNILFKFIESSLYEECVLFISSFFIVILNLNFSYSINFIYLFFILISINIFFIFIYITKYKKIDKLTIDKNLDKTSNLNATIFTYLIMSIFSVIILYFFKFCFTENYITNNITSLFTNIVFTSLFANFLIYYKFCNIYNNIIKNAKNKEINNL